MAGADGQKMKKHQEKLDFLILGEHIYWQN